MPTLALLAPLRRLLVPTLTGIASRIAIVTLRRQRLIALCTSLAFALAATAPADAGPLNKVGRAIKKTSRSVKKSSAKEIKKARRSLEKAGKAVNATTGEIAGLIDQAYDLTDDELRAAVKHADAALDAAVDQARKLAEAAIQALYREAYKKHVKPFGALAVDLTALMPKIGDRVETIGLHLAKGNFEKAAKLARELRHDEVMKDVLEKGHKLMGTSLVIVASGSFGGGTPNLGAGISSYVGIAINLGDGGPGAAVFLSSGGSLSGGVSNSTGNSLSAVVGVAVGLVKGDPTNAGGFCLDGGASVTAAGVTRTLSLCFPFTADKPPGSPTMFTVGVAAEIQSFDPKALGANISVGASYTHIVQRIK